MCYDKTEKVREYRNILQARSSCSESFQQLYVSDFDTALSRAKYIDQEFDGLPELPDSQWFKILTMTEQDFAEYHSKMKSAHMEYLHQAEEKKRLEDASQAENAKKVCALCSEYHISAATMNAVLHIPHLEVFNRISLINYYSKKYPDLHLDLEKDLQYDSVALKNWIVSYEKAQVTAN